jgi:hypothetical protein
MQDNLIGDVAYAVGDCHCALAIRLDRFNTLMFPAFAMTVNSPSQEMPIAAKA